MKAGLTKVEAEELKKKLEAGAAGCVVADRTVLQALHECIYALCGGTQPIGIH